MKFIDTNCMLGTWRFGKLYIETEEDLIKEMDRLGIEKTLVFDSRCWLWDPLEGNSLMEKELKSRDRLIPVMTLTPLVKQEFGGEDNIIEYISRNKAGAVRLFPNDQGFMLNRWSGDVLFSLLDRLRIPLMIECKPLAGSIDTHLSGICELSSEFPNVPVILSGMRLQALRLMYPIFEKCENIHMDTSMMFAFRALEDVVKHFGAGRLVFGSRMPFMHAAMSLGRIIYADISKEDKECIAWKNISSMLNAVQYLQKGGQSG